MLLLYYFTIKFNLGHSTLDHVTLNVNTFIIELGKQSGRMVGVIYGVLYLELPTSCSHSTVRITNQVFEIIRSIP